MSLNSTEIQEVKGKSLRIYKLGPPILSCEVKKAERAMK